MNRKMLKVSAFAVSAMLTGTLLGSTMMNVGAASSYEAEFNIDMKGETKEISPYIYGVNDHANVKKVTPTAIRQGGNRFTAYNWETNYSNAGSDWKNSSDTHLSTSSTPGDCAMQLSKKCNDLGVDYKFTTLQMAGYVSADKNGTVEESEAAPSKRWLEVKNRKDGELSLEPDLTDDAVYMDEYVNYLVKTLGDASTPEGIQGYSLDNEPALWNHTHSLIHGNTVGMKELVDKSVDLAKVVKDIDPKAEVFGPALWGYLAYKQLADTDDDDEWEKIKEAGGYEWFIEYYLDEMKKASDEYGSRLIDVLDIHYYAQAAQINKTPEDVLQGVRTLYEDGFRENSWIGDMLDWAPKDLPILPNIKNAIDKYYPGTKIAISEYDFYGSNDVTGSIAEAEALGCFASNDIYLATYWGDSDSPYAFSGINLYTNYDGKGSSFGDTLLETSIEDSSKSNAYASVHSDDSSKIDIVITNKDMTASETASVNIKNSDKEFKSGIVYGIVEGSSDIIVLDKIENIKDNSFKVELPSLSVVHVVLSEKADAFGDTDIFDPSAVPQEKEIKLEGSDLTKTEKGWAIQLPELKNLTKIRLETDISVSDGSSWYVAGGGFGFMIDTETKKNQWASKSYTVKNDAKTVDIEMDGTFTVPIDDTASEEQKGTIIDKKVEIQKWWDSAENGGEVDFTLKSITLFYLDDSAPSDTDPAVTTTTEETTTASETEATESESVSDTTTETTTSEIGSSDETTVSSGSTVDVKMAGDANDDSYVDVRDVAFLSQYLVHLKELTEQGFANADVTKDGEVTINDLTHLKRFLIHDIDKL